MIRSNVFLILVFLNIKNNHNIKIIRHIKLYGMIVIFVNSLIVIFDFKFSGKLDLLKIISGSLVKIRFMLKDHL